MQVHLLIELREHNLEAVQALDIGWQLRCRVGVVKIGRFLQAQCVGDVLGQVRVGVLLAVDREEVFQIRKAGRMLGGNCIAHHFPDRRIVRRVEPVVVARGIDRGHDAEQRLAAVKLLLRGEAARSAKCEEEYRRKPTNQEYPPWSEPSVNPKFSPTSTAWRAGLGTVRAGHAELPRGNHWTTPGAQRLRSPLRWRVAFRPRKDSPLRFAHRRE